MEQVAEPYQTQRGQRVGVAAGDSLRAAWCWTLAGSLVTSGSQWALLVVLAKLGRPELLGQFALALAITTPIVILTSLRLRAVQATDCLSRHVFGHYLALRCVGALITLALVAAVVVGLQGEVPLAVLLLVAAGKTVDSLNDVFYGWFQLHERMRLLGQALCLTGAGSLLAFALTLYLTGSLIYATASWAVVPALTLLLYNAPIAAALEAADHGASATGNEKWQVLRPRWEGRELWGLARIAFPLGLADLLTSLTTNVPRYCIGLFLNTRELGFFVSAAQLSVAGNILVLSLGQAVMPRLAKYHAAGDRTRFLDITAKMVAAALGLGSALVVAAAVAGKWLLRVFYTPEYAAFNNIFIWLSVAAALGFVSSLLTCILTAAGRFREQSWLMATVVVVLAGACLPLTQALGVLGAAAATLLAAVVQVLGLGYFSIKALRIDNEAA
jgi:O-antigen/teichoic acid export membrane protein